MYFVLLFCILHEVASIPHVRNGNEVHERLHTIDKVNERRAEEFNKEDASEFPDDSRKVFECIKDALNRTDANLTTPAKTPSSEEALNGRTRFRYIEKKLTETLTALSEVLTKILNIVSYTQFLNFMDLNELESTKLATNNFNRREMRLKRGSNEPTKATKADIEDILEVYIKGENGQNHITDPSVLIELENNINEQDKLFKHDNNEARIGVEVNYKDDVKDNHNLIKTADKSSSIQNSNESSVRVKLQEERIEKDIDGSLRDDTQKTVDNQIVDDKGYRECRRLRNCKDLQEFKPLEGEESQEIRFKKNANEPKNAAQVIGKSDGNIKADSKYTNANDERDKRYKRSVNETKTAAEKSEDSDTIDDKRDGNNTEGDKAIHKSGRRAMIPIKSIGTNSEVKNRLFKYIDESFTEIVKKIDSLRQTKQMLSQDVNFRIGYIISNIDTLEVNMRNLRGDMEKNRSGWDDRRILNLYDTVKASNSAVSDLMEILKVYIEKSLN